MPPPDIDLAPIEEEFKGAADTEWRQALWARRHGQSLIDTCQHLRDRVDKEMLRVKACEAIAEGDEGHEKLHDICPSTAAVALLRAEFDKLKQLGPAPAPSPPEIVLPEPDEHFCLRFNNIGYAFPLPQHRPFFAIKWGILRRDSEPWRDDANRLRLFPTPIEAARALQELGEGPGAKP